MSHALYGNWWDWIPGRPSAGEWVRISSTEQRYYLEGATIPAELAYQTHPPVYYLDRRPKPRSRS